MDQTTDTSKDTSYRAGMVHFILSHSYVVFLFSVVFGLILDIVIPISIFEGHIYQYIGLVMIIAGSVLIYWAQSTSGSVGQRTTVSDFTRGPYRYSRNPTHIGLTIMTLGLAFVINSLFSIVLIIIASFITKFIFLREEEKLLEEKYGQVYSEYKKKVSTWV